MNPRESAAKWRGVELKERCFHQEHFLDLFKLVGHDTPQPLTPKGRGSPLRLAIAEAACELNEKRQRWLNPEGLEEKELKKRTLTNLYNQRPTWLALAHQKLDKAVLDAYGWPHEISDLERLLGLNLEQV
ncbi:MAG: hypothetical protein JW757_07590 [Anaerolineales bacterium]|nr:hypothetical protein [Anaerolineales bacterium]